ncbi:MAG: right-handed parallel beta-helix repeat-containing protein [Verrucomicrobiaceae bacterium]
MKTTVVLLSVLAVPFSEARVVNVADHGIVPGKDVTLPVYLLLESLKDEAGVTLTFPKGTYDFYPENAYEEYRAVTNHDNSLKRMAFPLFERKDFTLDGGGSTFLFRGRMSPVVVAKSEGTTLKNFSIDWVRSFHSELPVVESNQEKSYFVAEVDRERYPYTVKGGEILFDHYNFQMEFGNNMVFDPETGSPIFNTNDYKVNTWGGLKVTEVGENRIKVESKFKKSPPPVGSVVVSYGENPVTRLAQAIHLDQAKDTKIENVTVYAAGGMAVIAERCENVELDGVKVTSTEERMISTRADATHFLGCKGLVKVENCLFEHMLDDSINVHGAYVRIDGYLGDRKFICASSHPQQWGFVFAEAGDEIAVLSRETVLPFFNATVEDVKWLNEERVIITVSEVPETLPEGPLSMENLTWYPDLIFRKNITRENRARSVLVTTKGKALLEENYFYSQMHGILIEGDNKSWYESGGVGDVTINNNVFENIGFEGGAAYPLLASPLLTPDQRMGEGHYHRNVRFTNNTIKSFNGLLAQAKSVKGLVIEGNKMEVSADYPNFYKYPSIDLFYCDEVSIKNNSATGFAQPLEIVTSENTTGVTIEGNTGFVEK